MPNGSSILLRVVDEVSDSIRGQPLTFDLHVATAPVAPPRLSLKADMTSAPVTRDCAGVNLEKDFQAERKW